MNVGQMARNQQMLYKFINRGAANGYQSQLSSQGGFGASGKTDGTSAAGLLQSMGISGLQGRTVREMAQYQVRVQQERQIAPSQQPETASAAGLDASALTQRFSVRQQYTPISDEATEAMQRLALEDAKNSVGSPEPDGAARANLIREQLQSVDPSKRTASFNTMNKVWESEMDRIGKYIREKDSNWQDWGDEFDASILDDYKPGVNVWV